MHPNLNLSKVSRGQYVDLFSGKPGLVKGSWFFVEALPSGPNPHTKACIYFSILKTSKLNVFFLEEKPIEEESTQQEESKEKENGKDGEGLFLKIILSLTKVSIKFCY